MSMSPFFRASLLAGWLCAVSAASGQTLSVAHIVPLTGPLANVGQEISAVTRAAFAAHNAAGREPKVELSVLDDGNDAAKSGQLAQEVSQSHAALLSCFGTVACLAQAKVANAQKMPLVGAIAGASALRGPAAGMSFAVRASAAHELRSGLRLLNNAGMTQVGVMVQDDAFGRSYAAELDKLAAEFPGMKFSSRLFSPGAPDHAAAAAAFAKEKFQALLLLANAFHSTNFLTAWQAQSALPLVLNMAGQANNLFASKLKGYKGLSVFVTVTPSPWVDKLPIQAEYRRLAQAASLAPSYLGFEAFINAQLLLGVLQQSRAKNASELSRALTRMTQWDVGGLRIPLAGRDTSASFTDIAYLRPDGSFQH